MQDKYGFVYIWYDRKRKMYYIGSHWGTETDGYICSSNRMRDAYRRRPDDFKRRILSRVYTNRSELLEKEQDWFDRVKRREQYYNLSFSIKNPWWNDEYTRLTVGQKISNSKKGQGLGRQHTEETKEKFKKRRHSEEWKLANSVRNKNKVLSEETKEKLKNIKRSQETKDKISLSKMKTYTFISPENEVHSVNNLQSFCENYNLCPGTMRLLHSGKYKRDTLKGWKKG